MANRVSLTALRSSVLTLGEWRQKYFTNTILNEFANKACAAFYNLVRIQNPYRFLKTYDFDVVSGTSKYALPDDFDKLVGCAAYNGVDGYVLLASYQFVERYDLSYTSTIEDTRYNITNETQDGYAYITFAPQPTWSQTVRLEYTPTYTQLTADSDTIDAISDVGKNWIVYHMAVQCANREESDPAVYKTEFEATNAELLAMLQLDDTEIKQVGDEGTLTNLMFSIRNIMDWPKPITDAWLKNQINNSIASYVDMITDFDTSYFYDSYDVTIVPSQSTYELPTDFKKLIGVSKEDSSAANGFVKLHRYNFQERFRQYSMTYPRYDVRGGNVIFSPTPNWSGTIVLEYIPKPAELVAPSDTFDFANSWQTWVISDVAINYAIYCGIPIDQFVMIRNSEEIRIKSASTRDEADVETMVSTRWGRYFNLDDI